MKRLMSVLVLIELLTFLATALPAMAHERLHTGLTGYQEVPAVSTAARGEFRAKVDTDESAVSWSLSYEDLQGGVQQAHIHLGQAGVVGGIAVFLCTNLGNGPAGTQLCPAPPATITGTFTAADVLGPAGQGISPGEFDELLAAIRAGVTYVNVHSTMWPTGEMRGQLDGPDRGD